MKTARLAAGLLGLVLVSPVTAACGGDAPSRADYAPTTGAYTASVEPTVTAAPSDSASAGPSAKPNAPTDPSPSASAAAGFSYPDPIPETLIPARWCSDQQGNAELVVKVGTDQEFYRSYNFVVLGPNSTAVERYDGEHDERSVIPTDDLGQPIELDHLAAGQPIHWTYSTKLGPVTVKGIRVVAYGPNAIPTDTVVSKSITITSTGPGVGQLVVCVSAKKKGS